MKPLSVLGLNMQPDIAILDKQHESYNHQLNKKEEFLKSCHECNKDKPLRSSIKCSNITNETLELCNEHNIVNEKSLKQSIGHYKNKPLISYDNIVTKSKGEQQKYINNISDELCNFNDYIVTKPGPLKCYINLNDINNDVSHGSFGKNVDTNEYDAYYFHGDRLGPYKNIAVNDEPLDLSNKSMSIKEFESSFEDICVRDEQVASYNKHISIKNESLIPCTEHTNIKLVPLQSCSEQINIDNKSFYSCDLLNLKEKSPAKSLDISDKSYDSCDLHIDLKEEPLKSNNVKDVNVKSFYSCDLFNLKEKSPVKSLDSSDRSYDSCDLHIDLEEKPLKSNNVKSFYSCDLFSFKEKSPVKSLDISDRSYDSCDLHIDLEEKPLKSNNVKDVNVKSFYSCDLFNFKEKSPVKSLDISDRSYDSCDLHIDLEEKPLKSNNIKDEPPGTYDENIIITDEGWKSYSRHRDITDDPFDSCSELSNLKVELAVKDKPLQPCSDTDTNQSFNSCDLYIDIGNESVNSCNEQIVINDPHQRSSDAFASLKNKLLRYYITEDNSKSIHHQVKLLEFSPAVSKSIQNQIERLPQPKSGNVCTNPNCRTTISSVWRRDENKLPVCNACFLYFKLRKILRPSFLRKDKIIPRKRYSKKSSSHPAAKNSTVVPAELSNINNVLHNRTRNKENIMHPVVQLDSSNVLHHFTTDNNHRIAVPIDLRNKNYGSHFPASINNSQTILPAELHRGINYPTSSRWNEQGDLAQLHGTSKESYQPSCSNENIMFPDQLCSIHNGMFHHIYRNQNQTEVLAERNVNNLLLTPTYDNNNNTALQAKLNNTSSASYCHAYDNNNNNCSYPRTPYGQDRNAYYNQDARIWSDQFSCPMLVDMSPHPEFSAARGPGFAAKPPGGEFAVMPPGGGFAAMSPGGGFAVIPQSGEFTTMRGCSEFASIPPSSGFAVIPPNRGFAAMPPGGGFTAMPLGSELAAMPYTGGLAALPIGGVFAPVPPSNGFAAMPPGSGFVCSEFAIPAFPRFAAKPTDHRFYAISADPRFATMPAGPRFATMPANSQFANMPVDFRFTDTAPDPSYTAMPADPRNFAMPPNSWYASMPAGPVNTDVPTPNNIETESPEDITKSVLAFLKSATVPLGPENAFVSIGSGDSSVPPTSGNSVKPANHIVNVPAGIEDDALPDCGDNVPAHIRDAAVPSGSRDATVPESSGNAIVSSSSDDSVSAELPSISSGIKIKFLSPILVPLENINKKTRRRKVVKSEVQETKHKQREKTRVTSGTRETRIKKNI